ncbi:MAG: hypothetical protein LC118_10590 [Dehalococcoidia bacterium]|nr:hypothetical protein [Dehalococcoidia bacterium]
MKPSAPGRTGCPSRSRPSAKVDRMFDYILCLTGVVNILVFVALIWFLIKYRHRDGRHATFIHGNNKLETAWTIAPAIILALTAVFSQTTWSQIKSPPANMATSPNVVEMEVVGQQFKWNFHYDPTASSPPMKRRRTPSAAEQIGIEPATPTPGRPGDDRRPGRAGEPSWCIT